MTTDKLDQMFELRANFMKKLEGTKSQDVSSWPLDLSTKESQRHLRDVTLRGVEEVFEALSHLKNWKPHRNTDIPEFDKEKFLEEWVDAHNYFFSVLILAGISPDDLFEMYKKKDRIIHERLKTGY